MNQKERDRDDRIAQLEREFLALRDEVFSLRKRVGLLLTALERASSQLQAHAAQKGRYE